MINITTFHSSLLREKFVVYDPDASRSKNEPVIALSNRMVVSLQTNSDTPAETYVIRTQNMHSCARLAGRLINNFNNGGSLKNRAVPLDWNEVWETVINDYERIYNDSMWVAIYYCGKPLFEKGDRHPLLDLIEKCDYQNERDYDFAIPMAEDALKQTGKVVKIEYDANVALVSTFEPKEGRCGVILRGADRTTTFNYIVLPSDEEPLNVAQSLITAAAFLEGIQLAFTVGMDTFKTNVGIIARNSAEDKRRKDGKMRLSRLGAEVLSLESLHTVRYRPERPDFELIVSEAEELASRTIDVDKVLREKEIEEATKAQEAAVAAKQAPVAEKPKDPDKPVDIFDMDD
jgi:hypothetical protein